MSLKKKTTTTNSVNHKITNKIKSPRNSQHSRYYAIWLQIVFSNYLPLFFLTHLCSVIKINYLVFLNIYSVSAPQWLYLNSSSDAIFHQSQTKPSVRCSSDVKSTIKSYQIAVYDSNFSSLF